MEAVGLTIGIASLFSTCIECFDLFQAAKNYDEYVEILLVKPDLEKTRLLMWGNGVGIMKSPADGRAPELDDDSKAPTVQKCLECIKSLLSTFDTFQAKYGLRMTDPALIQTTAANGLVSSSSMAMFRLTDRRFWVRNKTSRSFLPRIKWAIHEQEKFEGLINHLKDFIDGLNEIVPTSKEFQDQIVQDDIDSIIDISKLRLVEAACEGSYRAWSEKASQVIHDSEAGTLDRRTVEEYIRDQDHAPDSKKGSNKRKIGDAFPYPDTPNQTKQGWHLYLQNSSSVYFVITQKCESHLENQNALCSKWATEPRYPYTTLKHCTISGPQEYTIGGRIANRLDLGRINPDFEPLKFLTLLKESEEMGVAQSVDYVGMTLPIGKLYIHCAPCKCQISTAFSIADQAVSAAFNAYIRVDHRLSTCCSSNQELERMTQLQNEIKRSLVSGNAVEYVDQLWLDQKIMEIEDDLSIKAHEQPLVEEILSDYTISNSGGMPAAERKCCGVVILGEANQIQPLMRGSPFPESARMPRENEIWELNWAKEYCWRRKPLGSFTPSNFK